MSEPTFIGRVFIWGLDGTLAYEGVGTTENEPQSLTYKDDIQRHNTKDKKGNTVGIQLWDPNPKITIKFFPCAPDTGSGQIAVAKTKMRLPAHGSKVTLAGHAPDVESEEDLINSAGWLYLGGGDISENNEKEVEMTLPLERFNTDLAVDNS